MRQEIRIAFDVLFSNSEIQSAKPLVLNIGSVGKLYVYSTHKEITVSNQRHETSIKGPADVTRYSRCFESHTPWLQAASLELHPIHAQEQEVSHLLVHVPKPPKRQPYFKVRMNYRYLLTLLFGQPVPPNLIHLSVSNLPDDAIKCYEPLVSFSELKSNLFLEHSFAAFQVNSPAEAAFQQFLVTAHASDGPLNTVKWARYSLYDLHAASRFVEPGSDLSRRLSVLQQGLSAAFELLWRHYCSSADFQQDSSGILAQFPGLYSQIIPLCASVYTSAYARAKRELLLKTPIAWPHGPRALEQLQESGFIHSPTILQPDRAICRDCSFVSYAWRRLLPPSLHHQPTCPRFHHS